jgi:hypothetical protein
MPQLTPDYERVIIYGLLHSDDKTFDILQHIKLMIMIQEIRMSEDYSRSDIIVLDFSNYNFAHILKFSVANVKKYELCALVSTLVIRNMFNRASNVVIACHLGVNLQNKPWEFCGTVLSIARDIKRRMPKRLAKSLKSMRSSSKYGPIFQCLPQRKRETIMTSVNTQPALTHAVNISTRHHV